MLLHIRLYQIMFLSIFPITKKNNTYLLSHVLWFVGTTKIKNLESNIDSFKVKLSKDDLKEIEDAVPISDVVGDRTTDAFVQCSWKFANTPTKA